MFLYVFDNKNNNTDKFIGLTKRYRNCELITEYLKKGKQIKLLIKTLNDLWDSFYVDAEVANKWSQEDRTRLLQMEITHEKPEILKTINIRNDIRTDIESNADIFDSLSDKNRVNIIENLIAIDVKLQDIDSLVAANLFLADIYKNNLYKITIPNIRFWLKKVYNYQEYADEGLLLSTVLSQHDEPLSIYASDHLDELVGEIIRNYSTVKFSDGQIIISTILNSTTTSLETKKLYIDRLLVQIEDVSKTNDIEVIKLLLDNDLLKFSTNNLMALFIAFEKTFTEEFSIYLTKHEDEWVKDKHINSTLYPKALVTEFFNKALSDSSLNKMVTETLLSATKLKVTDQTAIVDEEKAKALISSRALVMNKNNLAYIRTNHPNLVVEFEKHNLKSFKEILDSEKNTDPQEIVDLLESGINGQEQYNLLHHVNVNIPYKESYRHLGVKKHIITHLLNKDDIEKLLTDPMAQSEKLISVTINAIIENMDFVVQKELALPYTLFEKLMSTNSVSRKNLLEVFSNSLNLYTKETIKKNILDLHISPFYEMFNGKRPKFEDNVMNKKILSSLEKKTMAKKSIINGRLYQKGNF